MSDAHAGLEAEASAPAFDVAAVFDADDYLYFEGAPLTPARSDRDVELIWRLLELRAGRRVLDLACGHGRIANRLAARGCEVVGLDLASAFLDRVRQDAVALGVVVEYVQGDMRDLPWVGHFDAVVNWFTAFGYFDDDGNRAVLTAAHAALKPGGILLLDLNNRDQLASLDGHVAVEERDDNYLIDRIRYDVASGRMRTERTILRDGTVRRMRFDLRLFTYPELATWLRQAGFRRVAGYDEEDKPFGRESRRMVAVSTK